MWQGLVSNPDTPHWYSGSHDLQELKGQKEGYSALAYEDRGNQRGALAMYKDAAMGNGPSVAEGQMQAGLQQAGQQQRNMLASARGGNVASANRQAGLVGSGMQSQAASQAAMLRAQEQQAAMAGYAGMTNTMADQSLGQEMGMTNAWAQANTANQAANVQWHLGMRELQERERQNRANNVFQGLEFGSSLIGGVVGGLGMSDERQKTGIDDGAPDVADSLSMIHPYSFEYKPGAGRPGRHVGVMAQDLEQVRPELVIDTPQGKMVDQGGAAMFSLAASADLAKRVQQLEDQKAGADYMRSPVEVKASVARTRAQGIEPTRFEGPPAHTRASAEEAADAKAAALAAIGATPRAASVIAPGRHPVTGEPIGADGSPLSLRQEFGRSRFRDRIMSGPAIDYDAPEFNRTAGREAGDGTSEQWIGEKDEGGGGAGSMGRGLGGALKMLRK